MVRIHTTANCGNSPKNTLLEQLTIAFAKHDFDFINEHVTDDVCCSVVGKQNVEGKTALLDAVKQREYAALNIQHAFSHGKVGAVNGTFELTDNTQQAFCYVYEFGSGTTPKIKSILAYLVAQK